jgi:hypothetical protein
MNPGMPQETSLLGIATIEQHMANARRSIRGISADEIC